MFKNLQRKFLYITTLSVTIVLLFIIGIINIFYYVQLNHRADQVLNYLALNGGNFPESSTIYGNRDNPFSIETPYRTRFFTVTINEETDTVSINTGHIASILPSEAFSYAQEVMERGTSSGYYKDFKYVVANRVRGYQIIFLDFKSELESLTYVFIFSILIFLTSLTVILILIFYLSKPIIRPIVENIEKQRQFITDASHEIKTPIAIISADVDVLEIEGRKDEWTQSIKEQVKRLNELIQNMLTLAKMDGEVPNSIITEFDLSSEVKDQAEKFIPIAKNDNKEYRINVEPDIKFSGNKDAIDQLVSVLLNNAFKYSNDEGEIVLNLEQRPKGNILEIYNTTDQVPEGNLNRLFDRFYRADKSRARETGSYGIGLSIAKAAVNQHKGEIKAQKIDENTILFKAVLNSI